VQLEDTTDKSAVTPGPLATARELLGEMLMQLGKPKPALAQFELTMKKEPGRFLTLYQAARAAKQAGDAERSRDYYQKLAKICERGDKPGRKELQEARTQ
jgi:tetratricopeptide (TPR) repeat protein